MELEYGAPRDQDDPRLAQLELLQPKVFAAYVAGILDLERAGDVARGHAWRDRPVDNVRCDPRHVAILLETCYEDLGVHGRSFFAFDHIAGTALRIARAVWEDSLASSCRW